MCFGFVEVERFGGWHFEGKVAFEDYCFEEGVGSRRRLRHIEDFVGLSR